MDYSPNSTDTAQLTHYYYSAYNPDGSINYYSVDTDVTDGDIDYSYDAHSRVTTKVYDFYRKSNSATRFTNTVTYGYSSYLTRTSGQVESVSSKVNSGSPTTYFYTYDDNGNITSITQNNGATYRYAYDNLGQLIREDNSVANRTYVYTYDDAGNILTKKEYALTAANATPTTLYSTVAYGYNDADWGDLLTSYGGDSITYDEIGNPIKIENPDNYGNEIFMEWDGRELTQYYVSSIVPYNICTYTYNDEGIRTSKTVDGVTHYYYLSGSQIIAEEWSNILCLYLYDADGSPIGMQYRNIGMTEGSFCTYWFEKNLQGDIVAVYSDSGVKLRTYTYDAWGNVTETVLSQSGTNYYARYNPFRYRGYYYDTETGLYYLQSRYYNPEWGRFLNADGYVSTGTGMLGYNMFAYCNNNPVMFIDPSGNLLFALIGAGLLLFGTTVLLTSSEKQEPTQAQIEQAITAASNADYYVTIDKNGSTTVDISISLSDEDTQFDSIASEYFYQALYDEAHQKLIEAGFDIEDSNLMTVDHIRWEFAIHKIGYDSKIPFLQGPCNQVDLNVDETFWTILDRFWGYLLG